MKNFTTMKRLAFLFLIISIITACSNDDSDNNLNPNNPNNPENSDFKFLSTIISDPTEPRDSSYGWTDTIVYKNGRPHKAHIGAFCSPGSFYQYEYGDNGKVSVVYSRSYNPHYEGGIEDFEEAVNIFENSTINENFSYKTEIEYNSNNKIKGTHSSSEDSSQQGSVNFEYDDKGRLYKKIGTSEMTMGGIYISNTNVYTVTEFDDKDQPLTIQKNNDGDISENNYEYGELKNPYYALYQEYGIFYDCRVIKQDFITPYVVEMKQYDSSSNYIFNYTSSDGEYPETIHYNFNEYDNIYEFNYR